MSERLRMVHEGWTCTTTACDNEMHWAGPGTYLSARAASKAAAEHNGWWFNLNRRGLLSYCPECAPTAKARKQARQQVAFVLADYRQRKGKT